MLPNSIGYNNFKLFINLRVERPYLYLLQPDHLLVLSITSREKTRYPHKFKLELNCSCLASPEYKSSLVNLNTKILIPFDKFKLVAPKYRINLSKLTHNCLTSEQIERLLIALKKYWEGGKRNLISVVLNS